MYENVRTQNTSIETQKYNPIYLDFKPQLKALISQAVKSNHLKNRDARTK